MSVKEAADGIKFLVTVSISSSRCFWVQVSAETIDIENDWEFPSRHREAFQVKYGREHWTQHSADSVSISQSRRLAFQETVFPFYYDPMAEFRSRNQDTLLFKHIQDGIVMPSLGSFDLVIEGLLVSSLIHIIQTYGNGMAFRSRHRGTLIAYFTRWTMG